MTGEVREAELDRTVRRSACSTPSAGPSRDWLGYVKSPRARTKIRQWFTKERREEAIEQGKEQIAKLMRKEGVGIKRVLTHESLSLVAEHFGLPDVSALYAAVGEGNLSAQAVVRRVIELHGNIFRVDAESLSAWWSPRSCRVCSAASASAAVSRKT